MKLALPAFILAALFMLSTAAAIPTSDALDARASPFAVRDIAEHTRDLYEYENAAGYARDIIEEVEELVGRAEDEYGQFERGFGGEGYEILGRGEDDGDFLSMRRCHGGGGGRGVC